ncbi:hypothetical protein LIPSTDRAFT_331637 [Lipomyces starkeyi NRRL Y-11557]|uniref:Uncharacterized protein n=1 Tax=Lipomyces starkeyi NRRL Y-11557 TaxID=675824 RepID=A0A1E3Q3Q1_LIPST|nr:hypothetical protein LIPSTDRAFT_331637 [Lipomyces starkeyi NRRL Y-11557]
MIYGNTYSYRSYYFTQCLVLVRIGRYDNIVPCKCTRSGQFFRRTRKPSYIILFSMFTPRKYETCPRSFILNSCCRVLFSSLMCWISLPNIIRSSTYSATITSGLMNRHGSFCDI